MHVIYMSVHTRIQAAHPTDSYGHCPQNRLTCTNQQAELCAPKRIQPERTTPRQAEEPHRRLWLSTRGTTTGEDRTARSGSSHPGPITPWPIFPRNESSAGQSSAASSTNTSKLPESPGHGHRHSSGTQHPAMQTTIRHSIRAATPPRSCQPSSHHDWLTRRSSSIPRIWETTGWGRSTGSRHLHGRMCRPSRRVTSVLGHQLPRGMSGDLGSVYPPDTLLDGRKGHAGAAERQCRRGRSPRPGSSWPAWPGAPARSAPTATGAGGRCLRR
jgi:hypothetical protein